MNMCLREQQKVIHIFTLHYYLLLNEMPLPLKGRGIFRNYQKSR